MNIQINEGDLENTYAISKMISEFDSPFTMAEYEKRLDGSGLVLTAEIDGDPVGFKVGYDRFQDGSFYSWMGGVDPDHRQKGIATELADYQEMWAKSQGYSSIKLKTRNKHEEMIEFSIKRGFDIIDSEPNDDIREIRIWMEKIL
ncbi:MAG: GNAT family N-acetyltransferase [Candidatus Marinimicrobia bacterium]|nr:GNAT family N-acetyltransferase [Candidatus Neomarinimicrobiota bacterium]